MSTKCKTHHNPFTSFKLALICLFFLFLLFLLLRTTSISISTNNNNSQSQIVKVPVEDIDATTCNKITPSLSTALLHYATSNITPQQTIQEISVTLKVLQRRSPCNFLVFGLGYDSLMWASLNHGGRTVFLEEDLSWIKQIQQKFPSLQSRHVKYNTVLTDADRLYNVGQSEESLCKVVGDPRLSKCELVMKGMPDDIYDVEWDLIMVDAPTGWHDGTPGRMSAIYTAGLMARNRGEGETDVFVHDVNRAVEDRFSNGFLCDGYLIEQVGRIRHFTVPSHRDQGRVGTTIPFCS